MVRWEGEGTMSRLELRARGGHLDRAAQCPCQDLSLEAQTSL